MPMFVATTARIMATSPVDLEKINDLLISLRKESYAFQFKLAVHTLQEIITEIPGLKSSGKIYKNVLLSIEEGLNEKVLTKKRAQEDLSAGIADFTNAYNELAKGFTQTKSAIDEVLYQAVGTDQLKVYEKNMDLVQKSIIKTGAFVGYVPILPLTGPPLDSNKLNRMGIAADKFAGYTILKKQFVAGISIDYLKDGTDITTVDPKKRLAKGDSFDTIVGEFKEIILSKYAHLHLTEIAPHISWWGATWFWFSTNAELSIWKRCTINENEVSSLKVRKWSFPFAK